MSEKEPETSLVQAFFVISGPGLTPQDATAALGITPTSSRSDTKLVSERADGDRLYRYPEWVLKTERIPSDDTDEEFKKLLAIIWPRRSEIVAFLEKPGLKASLGVTIRHFGYKPLIWLSPETLEKLSFFRVKYIVDIYDLSD